MAAKIEKGDRVVVVAGRDKGKSGEVLRVYPTEERVLVAGVNVVKRHQRQTARVQGGIVSKEAPLHLSKIAFVDPKTGGRRGLDLRFSVMAPRARRQEVGRGSRCLKQVARNGQAAQGGEATSGGTPPDGKGGGKKKGEAQAKGAAPAGETARDPNYVPRFKKHYLDVVRPELMQKFGYKNLLQAPRIEKIVLNIGRG
jgi:large subunit ribosomal protein L24